jgi:putative transferase (TIGR04331 family)
LSRTLITTAIEQTWPKSNDEPLLFLGEWCKRYSRKESWEKFNSTIAPYHWDDRKKLYSDYQYLQGIYEKLLLELSEQLNQIHETSHSQRYWRILIGPWLGFFLQMLFDRWVMLKQSIEKLECSKCIVIERNPLSVIPNDFKQFIVLYEGDDWNEAIYGQLLDKCFSKLIKIEKIQLQQNNKNQNRVVRQGWSAHLSTQVKRWIFHFNRLFPNENGYFFISSYLPLKSDLILQMRLGQFPRIWKSKQVPVTNPDIRKRQWKLDGTEVNKDPFEVIVRQFIPLHIPTSYLEGYELLMQNLETLPWPKKPQVIFTSNAYLTDDLFKAWSAKKVETSTPLVIGQHGGHFGMTPFHLHEEHQIKIATKWLSWGWSDSSRPQITPVGNIKTVGVLSRYDPNGGALMVEMIIPRYSYHLSAYPISSQWLDYQADQMTFLKALPETIRDQVLLRLDSQDYGWDQYERWHEQMPEIRLDLGHQNIDKLIAKSRVYISTYNATTPLESLTWNIPSIIFWNPEHWELKEDVKPFFELLESVGIFHKTPESAANHMVNVWDDVSTWWQSNEVQSARIQFCQKFSKTPDNLISDLKKLFQDLVNNNDLSI